MAASNLSTDSVALYRMAADSRGLVDVAARRIEPGYEPYGLCMYHSGAADRFYAFITSRIDPTGVTTVEQWELFDVLEYDGTAVWGDAVDAQTPSAIPLSAFKLVELPPRSSG